MQKVKPNNCAGSAEALEPFRTEVVIAAKFGFKEGKTSLGLDNTPKNIKP
jgi:hypothetical protein